MKNVVFIGGGAGQHLVGCKSLIDLIVREQEKGVHLVNVEHNENKDIKEMTSKKLSEIIKEDKVYLIHRIDNDMITNQIPLTAREAAEFKSRKFYDDLYKKKNNRRR